MKPETIAHWRDNPLDFGREVLKDFIRYGFSPAHEELGRQWREMHRFPLHERAGRRYAIAAPRGHAKSTIGSMLLPIHAAVFRLEAYIVIISATQKQARKRIQAIDGAIRSSAKLRCLLGGHDERQSSERVMAGNTLIEAYSAGTEMRGISYCQFRPTLIILDDVESTEGSRTEEGRQKLQEWYQEVVVSLGDGSTNMLMLGTVLHKDSLLQRMLISPLWASSCYGAIIKESPRKALWDAFRGYLIEGGYKAALQFYRLHSGEMDEGAEVLWPEKESYFDLMVMREEMGERTFQREKQNRADLIEETLLPRRYFRLEEPERGFLYNRYLFLDSAKGTGKGDYAAIAVVGKGVGPTVWVEDLWAGRCGAFEQAQTVAEMAVGHEVNVIGLEANAFQHLMAEPILEALHEVGHKCRMVQVNHSIAKDTRIAKLEAPYRKGLLRFTEKAQGWCLDQVMEYPFTRHDDLIDALAGAHTLAASVQGQMKRVKADCPRNPIPGWD